MSSFESLRDFISQRLTAAAAEIFSEFEKTIEEEVDRQCRLLETSWRPQTNINTTEVPQQHVYKGEKVLADLHLCYDERNSSQDQNQPEPPQFKEEQEELFSSHQEEQLVLNQDQEEISVRHRLLDISCNPEIRLHRIDLPQQHVCKEEEDLWDQERNSSLDQEEPDLPQMKEEQEELCSSQEGEQLVLKQETDTFMLTPTDQERDLSEAEPNTEQLYSHNSALTERTNQEQRKNVDSGSTIDTEMSPKKRHGNRTVNVDHSYVSKRHLNTESGEKPFKCDFCGKAFRRKSDMLRHYKIHTGEKPFKCKTCGKAFGRKGHLLKHTRIHTGEKPYSCKICGKGFRHNYHLTDHTRIHTGEKPFLCKTCGKAFSRKYVLLQHSRIHTGEKPFSCKICRKSFGRKFCLSHHMSIHADISPFKCKTCGKAFSLKGLLQQHAKIHTDEKLYFCEICGKCFRQNFNLITHMRIHTGEKTFKCQARAKVLSERSTLLKHSTIHTDGH